MKEIWNDLPTKWKIIVVVAVVAVVIGLVQEFA
jgi:hypothetical protein